MAAKKPDPSSIGVVGPKKPLPPAPSTGGGAAAADAGGGGGGGGAEIGEGGYKAISEKETLNVGGVDKLIQKNLSDRLSGKGSGLSDKIMAMQKEKLFRDTQGATRRGRMALMADAARRGVFRSEATGTLIRDVEVAGMQQFSSGVKDLMIQKAKMDHDDMIKALDQAQSWVTSTRQYQLGLEQNAISREQIKATLAAAAMSAAATRYAADQSLKGARAAAGASRFAANLAFQSSTALIDGEQVFYTGSDGNQYPVSINQANHAGLGG